MPFHFFSMFYFCYWFLDSMFCYFFLWKLNILILSYLSNYFITFSSWCENTFSLLRCFLLIVVFFTMWFLIFYCKLIFKGPIFMKWLWFLCSSGIFISPYMIVFICCCQDSVYFPNFSTSFKLIYLLVITVKCFLVLSKYESFIERGNMLFHI